MAKLFDDSKTFVDMKLKSSPDITLQLFADFMLDHNNNPSSEAVRQFVSVSFRRRAAFARATALAALRVNGTRTPKFE